jgi:biopolymer transport protein ExbB
MEYHLGFAHFLASTDGVARVVLGLMLDHVGRHLVPDRHQGRAGLSFEEKKQPRLPRRLLAPRRTSTPSPRRLRETGVNEPFSHLVHHGFTAIEQHKRRARRRRGLIDAGTPDEFLTRALKRAIGQDKSRLEYGQTFLATVASSAPFVGLFGTVWGIYHALMAIGMSGQGTLDKVAGPVGEALIMTAIGLAVAIPAAVAYNAFARANRNTLAELDSFAHDVFAFLATGLKAMPQGGDVAATSERILARVAARSA